MMTTREYDGKPVKICTHTDRQTGGKYNTPEAHRMGGRGIKISHCIFTGMPCPECIVPKLRSTIGD